MYLSEAQLYLLDKLHETKLDLLDVNIATACALILRGLVGVKYGKKSMLYLTDAGEALDTNFFRNKINYRDMLAKLRTTKHNRRVI